MREKMIYNPGIYQLRENALKRMLQIIKQRESSQEDGIVLFGDSIFEFWDTKKSFDLPNLYNCGIAGATTDELLWFIDEGVIKYKPKKVFIHVGTNDLGNTVMHSPREIANNIEKITEIIARNCPDCQIYLLTPLPCNEAKQSFNVVKGIRSNKFLQEIGNLYQEFVPQLPVIDTYSLFMNETVQGKILLKEDGLHPNEAGYNILKGAIETKL